MSCKHLLSVLLLSLLVPFAASAADRTQAVQSKIHQALGSFLEKTDYIVMVNRLDPLGEDLNSNAEASGYIKSLPGLSVGVDAKGQIVRQDNSANQYSGPVAIQILLDRNVKAETLKMINNSLPMIIGGLNEMDEIKVSQATLRQTPSNVPSPITVNNNSGASKTDNADFLKLFAMMLMIAGALAWLMGRFNSQGQGKSNNSLLGNSALQKAVASADKISPKSVLNKLKPESVGMFLLKVLKTESKPDISWFYNLSLENQKNVFTSLPAWVSAFLEKTLKAQSKNKTDFHESLDKNLEAELFRQITVLEQNFKQETDWKKAFIMWFPAQSLRFVPKQYQHKFSQSARKCLWYYRPDLGDFVKAHDLQESEMNEPSALALGQLFDEIAVWPSNLFETSQAEQKDLVETWAAMINQLQEFGSLESQFKQAQEKLNPEQYQSLLLKAANKESPFHWDQNKIKTWLRKIDPQDYFWWLSLCEPSGQKPSWKLATSLRPLRLSMFEMAQSNLAYPSWTEAEKKSANQRLLRDLRSIHLGEELSEDLAA
jgi:hypothetical protein